MASGFTDATMGARAIGTRTNAVGSSLTDISAEEDRFANIFVSEGWISPSNAFIAAADTSWNIDVGSGSADTDYYVIEGAGVGQGNYVVRLDDAGEVLTIDAADISNPRYDQIYLVVMDNAYDASGLSVARLAVREGDPGASPEFPGADGSWLAYALLATVYVPAAAANITECTFIDDRIQSQSNLDAPTLEGSAVSAFALATHDHDATYATIVHEGSEDGHPDATGSVDGLMSAADKAKLNGLQDSADANLTPAEALVLVKTVDGSGSGLDADLLDGSHASAFQATSHNHDGTHYTETESNAQLLLKANSPEVVWIGRDVGQLTASGFEGTPLFINEYEDYWNGHSGTNGYIDDSQAGFYLVEAQLQFASSTGGNIRQIRLLHNAAGNVAFGRSIPIGGGIVTTVRASTVVYMDGGNRITMYHYQDSGGNLQWNGGKSATWLKLTFLG